MTRQNLIFCNNILYMYTGHMINAWRSHNRGISQKILLIMATAAITLSMPACVKGNAHENSTETSRKNNVASETAPTITGQTFEHGDFNLNDHIGKPVLINFWFPSCPPCRAEIPDLQTVYENYIHKVVFIGVQQLGMDSAANGQAFLRGLGITYPNMPDVESQIQTDYEIYSFPSTIFLNKNHKIVRTWTGIIREQQLAEQLDELLES